MFFTTQYCDICKREHTSVGMYIATFPNKTTRHCYQSKEFIVLSETTAATYASFYDVYAHAKMKQELPVVILYAELYQALKQVMFIKISGGTSCVLLKIDDNEYEIQKYNSFIQNVSKYYVNHEEKISFAQIISKYQYELSCKNIVFCPRETPINTVNLFTGFAAKFKQPEIAKVQTIIAHIHNIWAAGDTSASEYILDWLANIIQGNKNSTALVLYSNKQGAGKNIITDFMRRVIGMQYTTECNDIEMLVSKFNNKFANKLLTMINEANSIEGGAASYHKTFDKLKDLITNGTITIERKGMDSFEIADYNNYIITTNNSRPVKIEVSDRRYSLFRLSEERVGDIKYFEGLYESLAGAEDDFLSYLHARNIKSNLRIPLMTKYKQELLDAVADPIAEFAHDVKYESPEISQDSLHIDYDNYCSLHGHKSVRRDQFIKTLSEIGYIAEIKRRKRAENGKRINYNVIILGELAIVDPNETNN